MGLLKTLGHLKTPVLPLSDTVYHTQQGLPIQQSCPCIFNYLCAYICIVLYHRYNYVCVLAEHSIKEGDFRCTS